MGTDRQEPTNEPSERLPPLLHFLCMHMLLGLAIGVAFASLVVMTNVAGLKDLLAEADNPVLPLLLFYGFNALTFASVTMGIAIMIPPSDER